MAEGGADPDRPRRRPRAVEDPTNDSDALDRTHVRRLLAATEWLDPARLAAASANLADAEEALAWTMDRVWQDRGQVTGRP
jgi:tRNA(Ile)-lysidine synthase